MTSIGPSSGPYKPNDKQTEHSLPAFIPTKCFGNQVPRNSVSRFISTISWPRGGQTRLTLPNDHLQYALTWFGLAATLLVVSTVSAWRRFHKPQESRASSQA